MYPISYALRESLSANIENRIIGVGWRDGVRLPYDFDFVSGSLTLTGGTGVRATMSATVVAEPGMFDALTFGATLRLTWRSTFIDGTREDVPLAVIDIDDTSVTYDADAGTIDLAGDDPWARVVAARFGSRQQPRGNIVDIVRGWVADAVGTIPQAGPGAITPTTISVSRQVYDRERHDAIVALLDSISSEAFIDRRGGLVVRRKPILTGSTAWSVTHGQDGILVGATRRRSLDDVYNAVVVTPTSPGQGFSRFEVSDTSPSSPTRVRPGFYRPVFLSDPRFTSRPQAYDAALAKLRESTSHAASIDVTTAPNPGIDPGDVIAVHLPANGGDTAAPERHLVQTVTIPFGIDTQAITTRSSRPTAAGDEEST